MMVNRSGAQPTRITLDVGKVPEAFTVDVYKPEDLGNGHAPPIIVDAHTGPILSAFLGRSTAPTNSTR
jgi:dipeptidyl aminopeptidase/acylaminoacyl peptidase